MVQITGRPQKPKQESILRSDSLCLQDMFTKKSRLEETEEELKVWREHITKKLCHLASNEHEPNLDEKAGGCPATGHSLTLFHFTLAISSQLHPLSW